MNRLEFVASLVGSLVALAWPAAVVILVLAFRSKIWDFMKELMGKESGQVEAGMFKAAWEAKAAALEAEIGGVQEADRSGGPGGDRSNEPREIRDHGMAAMSMHLMTIYNALEDELQARGVEVAHFQSLEAMSAAAVAGGIIEPDDHKALTELSRLIADLAKVPVSDRGSLTPRLLRMAERMERLMTLSTQRARGQRLNQDQ
jgi:hypothetical protein